MGRTVASWSRRSDATTRTTYSPAGRISFQDRTSVLAALTAMHQNAEDRTHTKMHQTHGCAHMLACHQPAGIVALAPWWEHARLSSATSPHTIATASVLPAFLHTSVGSLRLA